MACVSEKAPTLTHSLEQGKKKGRKQFFQILAQKKYKYCTNTVQILCFHGDMQKRESIFGSLFSFPGKCEREYHSPIQIVSFALCCKYVYSDDCRLM